MKHTSRQGYVRPQSPAKDDALRKLIEKALSDDLIEASQAARFSQVLLTMKQNNTYRFCVDYRELNAASESLGWPLMMMMMKLVHNLNAPTRPGCKKALHP